jgi:hypothetical protein
MRTIAIISIILQCHCVFEALAVELMVDQSYTSAYDNRFNFHIFFGAERDPTGIGQEFVPTMDQLKVVD